MILQEYLDKKYTKEEQKNLKELDCSNNNLTSLNGIKNLTNLKDLYCSSNKLTSLNGIEMLTNLTELYCHYNNLTDLKSIYRLDKLEYLKSDIKIKI